MIKNCTFDVLIIYSILGFAQNTADGSVKQGFAGQYIFIKPELMFIDYIMHF